MPTALLALTLTDSVKAAESAFLALGTSSRDTSELRIVIYPGRYRGGRSYDVTGGAGGLTATCARDSGRALTGMIVEELLTATEQSLPRGRKGFRLIWAHPTVTLSAPEPPTGNPVQRG